MATRGAHRAVPGRRRGIGALLATLGTAWSIAVAAAADGSATATAIVPTGATIRAGPGDPGPSAGPTAVAPPARAGRPAPGAAYRWPLSPAPAVLNPFRPPDHAFGPGHRGVDLAGTPGQAVLAARAGVVVFAGPLAGRGVVSVEHEDGLRTTYEPLRPAVRVGATVEPGALLGTLQAGHRGCAQACLHWGVRRDRLDYLDPLVLLRPARVRLLPVPDPGR
jgi:murein DD-endopeptidase MepM/ murein hydrolase activator NlpD